MCSFFSVYLAFLVDVVFIVVVVILVSVELIHAFVNLTKRREQKKIHQKQQQKSKERSVETTTGVFFSLLYNSREFDSVGKNMAAEE